MRLIVEDALKGKAVPLLFPTKMEPCGHIPVPVQAVVAAEIEQAPTIDAEPVRHGRWEKADNLKPKCSVCGEFHLYSWPDHKKCNYCPNCGAKMDGDDHAV